MQLLLYLLGLQMYAVSSSGRLKKAEPFAWLTTCSLIRWISGWLPACALWPWEAKYPRPTFGFSACWILLVAFRSLHCITSAILHRMMVMMMPVDIIMLVMSHVIYQHWSRCTVCVFGLWLSVWWVVETHDMWLLKGLQILAWSLSLTTTASSSIT